jgi:hypothetical protein
MPGIKRTFRIQTHLLDASNYKLIYKNPSREIEEVGVGDDVTINFPKFKIH